MVIPQVLKVDGFGDKVKRPPVHGRADVFHVAISRDDDRADVGIDFGNLFEQGEAVHLRHVDVCEHHVDVGVLI